MNVEVTGLPVARNELASIWTGAADQGGVTAASNRIDRRLAADPLNEGESRGGIERITFEAPLRVLVRVVEAERAVEVYSAGGSGQRA